VSAFWDIVADAVEDKVDHDHWCSLARGGSFDDMTRSELHAYGFRCDCTHGFAIAVLRKGPLS
jgi:hypothetical protein